MEEKDQGNDWLYLIIADIIANHNLIIKTVVKDPPKISPTEIAISNAVVCNFTEYVIF